MVKRAAPSPAGGPRKKSNADPMGPKCKDVVHAIQKANALPDTCKEMLSSMVTSSLTVFASDRHAYQNQGIKMLGETLASVHTQMQKAVSEAQVKVDSSDREKASRAAALETANKNFTNLEQKQAAAKDAVDNSKTGVSTAKTNLESATEAAEGKEEEVETAKALKSKLETVLAEVYEKAKTDKVGAKDVTSLGKVLAEAGLEAGLIDSLPETFKKAPEARGTFDGLVLKHVGEQAGQCMAKTDATIKAAEQSTANLANSKASAEAGLTASQEKLSASSASLDAAEAALKEGKANLKQAQAGLGGFDRDMTNAASELDAAKEELATFTEVALKSFNALKDLAPPPAPEPEVAAAPEAAAAAAPTA